MHVDVGGLAPATFHWYRFRVGGVDSPVGRTKTMPETAPSPDTPSTRLRIGVVCCSHFACGFFNAYAALAGTDLDLVVHLGDYIYESGPRPGRVRRHRPARRCLTLPDYRARHAQYRTDPDLAALHAAHPVVAMWDDHELAGNAWWGGAADHDPRRDGPWSSRRAAAVAAYRDWLPVPPPGPAGPFRLWRTVPLGPLADLLVLDARLEGRAEPVANALPALGVLRRDRPLLGEAQWSWLESELTAGTGAHPRGPAPGERAPAPAPHTPPGTGARWRIVASQVVVAPVHLIAAGGPRARRLGATGGGFVVNPGQWDGYPDERERLLRALAAEPGRSVIVSGDLHSSWAAELAPEESAERPGPGGPVTVEFTTPAVSAPSFARVTVPRWAGRTGRRLLERVILAQNRHVHFVDTAAHGYLVLDVTADRVEAELWHVETISRRDPARHLAAAWTVRANEARLNRRA